MAARLSSEMTGFGRALCETRTVSWPRASLVGISCSDERDSQPAAPLLRHGFQGLCSREMGGFFSSSDRLCGLGFLNLHFVTSVTILSVSLIHRDSLTFTY